MADRSSTSASAVRGKQVRDLLHVDDLVVLLEQQFAGAGRWDGVMATLAAAGECRLSLLETTALCAEITGNVVPVEHSKETRPGDLALYISDCHGCSS